MKFLTIITIEIVFSSLKVEVKVENFCSLAAAFLHIIMGGFHLLPLISLSYTSSTLYNDSSS